MSFKKSFIAVLAVTVLVLQLTVTPFLSLSATSSNEIALDSFENVTLSNTTTVTDENTILWAQRSFSGAKHTTVGTADYAVPDGSKALKVSMGQPGDGFYIKTSSYAEKLNTTHSLAFYIDIPAASADKDNWIIRSTNNGDYNSISTSTTLSDFTVTYYFADGTKKVMQNQSAIYAYGSDGNISSTGFKGYVAIDLKGKWDTANGYLILQRKSTIWTGRTYYFDDFCLVGDDFAPYTASTPTPPPTQDKAETVRSIENFESCSSFTDLKVGKYSNLEFFDYYSAKFSLNTDKANASEGKNSLKVHSVQGMSKFYIDLTNENGVVPDYENITFYVNMPAGVVNKDATADTSKYPDKKIGFLLDFTTGKNQWNYNGEPSKMTVTYYFPNGKKLVKTGESGVYPYDEKGNVSTTGFKGYVSVKFADGALDTATEKYLVVRTYSKQEWSDNFLLNPVYFDDFRCIDPDKFTYKVESGNGGTGSGTGSAAVSAIENFEKVPSDWDPNSKFVDSRVSTTTYYGTVFALDTKLKEQGKRALKATLTGQGNFEFYVKLKDAAEAAPTYSDLAFYVKLPEGTYVTESGTKYGIKVTLNDAADNKTLTELNNATVTYYFKSGKTLTLKKQDGIYPYDKDGKITNKGFDGYVAINLNGNDLSKNCYARITATTTAWGTAFANNDIYFDDFRGVTAKKFVPYDGKDYVEPVDPEIKNGYTLVDWEGVDTKTYDPNKWNDQGSNFLAQKYYGANFSVDTTGRAQGKNTLKIGTSDQGAFETQVIVPAEARDASRFDGIAFYCTIPAGDYLDAAQRVGFTLTVTDNKGVKTMANATVTYIFEDGKQVKKTGQDGIYSFNKSGSIEESGFKGYVIVSFDSFEDLDETTVKNIVLKTTASYKESFKSTTFYIDDFRLVYAKTFDPFGLYTSSPHTADGVVTVLGILSANLIMAAAIVVTERKRILR